MLPGINSRRIGGAAGGGGGGGAGLVNVINGAYSDYETYPTAATCGITYSNSGNVTAVGGPAGTWRLSGASSDYDIRFDINGATGTWQNLATSKSYTLSRSLPGDVSSTVGIYIRRASDLALLDSGTSTFNVVCDPG